LLRPGIISTRFSPAIIFCLAFSLFIQQAVGDASSLRYMKQTNKQKKTKKQTNKQTNKQTKNTTTITTKARGEFG
jgi:hypothetical protein